MSVEQFVAILGALAALATATAALVLQVREYHKAVNSKMDQVLELTRAAAYAEGELEAFRDIKAIPPPST